MDPLTLAIGAVGLGASLFGGISSANSAHQAAQVQQQEYQQAFGIQTNISNEEQQVNNQRQQQMEMSARRQSLQQFRTMQQARAQSIANSTSQNAQFSSSAKSGADNTTAQGLFNVSGINQNLAVGENIFSLDRQISASKLQLSGVQTAANIQLSGLQSDQATDQGIANIGGALMKGAGTISNIFNAGSTFAGNYASLMSPGSLSGGFGKT